jgi:hypothetical protein
MKIKKSAAEGGTDLGREGDEYVPPLLIATHYITNSWG